MEEQRISTPEPISDVFIIPELTAEIFSRYLKIEELGQLMLVCSFFKKFVGSLNKSNTKTSAGKRFPSNQKY